MTWTEYPQMLVETPLGTVRLAVTNGEHVAAMTESGQRLAYRGDEYSANVHFYRTGDEWATRQGERQYISRDFTDAPPTYAKAIIAVLLEAVKAIVTPAMLAEAEHADASNKVDRLDRELAEAKATVDRLKAERAVEVRRALKAQTDALLYA